MLTGLITLALTAAIGFVVAAGYRSLRRASRS